MLTSKERAALRSKANDFETILIVGKGGITENVIAEAERALEARELIKCRVLESAMLTAREASDAICAATGADGVSCVGSRFIIYRKSRKTGTAKAKPKKISPVHKGIRTRRQKRIAERNEKNAYFKKAAIAASIEKSKQKARKTREES